MSAVITEIELIDGLNKLGVEQGMMLEVHCSLSSIGYVENGAKTVITALKKAIGNEGAIVMPSFMLSSSLPLTDKDKEMGLTEKIRILQDDKEPSAMGIVADTFRKMPDVITGHGIFRVSAWGKDADKHSLGFQHLIDSGGFALLIGVDIYKLSAMHYVENCMPIEMKNKFVPHKEALEIYPEDKWFIETWTSNVKPWYVIQQRAYEKGYIVDGMIGNSACMLLNVKNVIELYRDALINEPFELYGMN